MLSLSIRCQVLLVWGLYIGIPFLFGLLLPRNLLIHLLLTIPVPVSIESTLLKLLLLQHIYTTPDQYPTPVLFSSVHLSQSRADIHDSFACTLLLLLLEWKLDENKAFASLVHHCALRIKEYLACQSYQYIVNTQSSNQWENRRILRPWKTRKWRIRGLTPALQWTSLDWLMILQITHPLIKLFSYL